MSVRLKSFRLFSSLSPLPRCQLLPACHDLHQNISGREALCLQLWPLINLRSLQTRLAVVLFEFVSLTSSVESSAESRTLLSGCLPLTPLL